MQTSDQESINLSSEIKKQEKSQELTKNVMDDNYYKEAIEVERGLGRAINRATFQLEKLQDRIEFYKLLIKMCIVIIFTSISLIAINQNTNYKWSKGTVARGFQDISVSIVSGIGGSFLFFSISLFQKQKNRLEEKIKHSQEVLCDRFLKNSFSFLVLSR